MIVVFANIDSAMAHEYGLKIQPAMAAILKLFGYRCIHTANSLKTIMNMKELGSADGVYDMKAAPSPSSLRSSNGTANAVDNSVAQMKKK